MIADRERIELLTAVLGLVAIVLQLALALAQLWRARRGWARDRRCDSGDVV